MIRAFWRRPSALTAIGGFSVAIAILSVAITASIVLLMPDPPAVRLTLADAAAALRGAENGLVRSIGAPPAGPPNPIQQQVLAQALGRPVGDVRVVWLDAPPRKRPVGEVIVVTPHRGSGSPFPGGTMVLQMKGGRPMRVVDRLPDGPLGTVLLRLPQPPFAAGVRLSDGRWLTVRPAAPLLGGWRWKVLVALAVSLVVLAPLAWLFARRLTRPFRVLARAIDAGLDPPQAQGPRELQEAAGAILQLRTRLAAESEDRLRMLTAVAHDLRTPLTSLKLRLESVPEPQRARMVADANRMQAMIADVLDFARTADATRHPVGLRPLVAEVVADAPAMTLDPGPEVTVSVVEAGLRRAVENLVRNAVDYAGGGRIAVARDGDRAVIEVIDTGPGIAPADRTRLLRPFERGDASRNRDTGGVGLGLSIVQGFAERHGGTLELADAPGGGMVARLVLPAVG
ncbi:MULTISPECIES: sensor histidine kinase [Sphingomonas]|uniref:histidine kinase n=1 Tax=Sphingomonas hankookensis TaxID=563996 RepID=A0ABR5YB15_9SPHN|nr:MULTISPECIES: HAMP domain-containing sensor histidine kinase [Sphingomonas]KZE12125.1 hypothetical protein AVT10_16490 [Sphingomonas hankookensis]PZT91492.1 MAG: sensor histidine kinase [Sphingomonas sp.]WCP74037.1 HAMP domain-containing sensor histidine kinase [Sphingomonas hankookensis]